MRVAAKADNPLERAGMAAGVVPEPLFETYVAIMAARCVMAGVRLGIFEALDGSPDDVDGLAERLGLDPGGVDVLLPALHAQGLLRVSSGRYEVTPDVRRWLLRDSARSLTDWVGFTYDMWEHMGHLEEVLRSGEPIGLHGRAADDPYWERYMRGLFDLSKLSAGLVARMIGVKGQPRRLLDLAGGHGGFSMALCRRHPELRATIVELEGSARIGRRIVEEQGFSDRIDHVVGDVFETELGTQYDIAMANSILHHLEPERCVALLRRARGALRDGGTMAVYELDRPRAGRRGTQIGTLTGVLFFVTSRARTYAADELREFFREAGFSRVRARRFAGNVLVTGRA